MYDRFLAWTQTLGWANARDVQTLAKAIIGKTVRVLVMES
jgi:hypothetical protein